MYTVLLVDDEEMILKGLQKLIHWEDYGLEITGVAQNGHAALALLKESPRDILISDIRMPEMGGIELLREVRALGLSTKTIIISGHDDFSYVQHTLRLGIENYLLKPVNEEELSATLLTITEKLDNAARAKQIHQFGVETLMDNVLYRWLNGDMTFAELGDRARLLGINLGLNWYLPILLQPDRQAEPDITQRWRRAVGRLFEPEARAYSALTPENALIVLLAGERPLSREVIRTHLLDAIDSAAPSDADWAAVLLGSAVSHAEDAPLGYQTIDKIQTLHMVLPENSQPVLPEEVDAQSSPEADFSPLSRLRGLLDRGNLNEATEALTNLFDQLTPVALASPPQARKLLVEAISLLFQTDEPAYWRAHPPALPLASGDMPFAALTDLHAAIQSAAAAYIAHQQIRRQSHPVVQKVLQYVAEHYAEDISLKTLSAQMHFNAAYLGQLFKQYTGRLFPDYLCDLRIEKAKLLLLETTHKNYDIASMVGFRNPNYFANVFRKLTGVYPTVYRKLHAQQPHSPH